MQLLNSTALGWSHFGWPWVWGEFTPANLFSNTAIGIWLDPSDLSTMFSDRAGTTPVTTPGTTVGLRLDKSKGLALGAELVTNGWTDIATTTSSIVGGKLRVVGGTNGTYSNFSLNTKVGSTYLITFNASVVSPGTFYVIPKSAQNGGGSNITTLTGTTNTNYRGVFVATTTSEALFIQVAGTWDFDNISVKELAGNHAVAPTDAARPIYGVEPKGGRRNLLLATDDFLTSLPGTVATTNNQSPTGALNAYGFTETTDNIQRSAAIANTATNQTRSFYVRRTAGVSTRYLAILATNVAAGGAFFNLATGTVTTNNPANFTATIQLVGDFWRCSITRVDAVNSDLMLCITSQNTVYSGSQAYTGDGVSKFVIWGAQLEAGTVLTNYQRVTTAYDVTESGVATCHYVQYDGADDSMSTSAIDFTGTDKMSVFAGVRKLSDASIGSIVELSADANSNSGSFWLFYQTGSWSFRSRGVTGNYPVATKGSSPAPETALLSGIGDISGDVTRLRYNGAVAATDTTDQGTGNYGNYPLFIGRRNNTTLPFNGKDYGIIVVGKLANAIEIAATERWLASKTAGVTL